MQTTVKVMFHGLSNRRLGSDFTLAPGENPVPVEVWKKWKDHPQIAALVTSKTIEAEEVKSEPAPASTDSNQGAPSGSGGSLLGRRG